MTWLSRLVGAESAPLSTRSLNPSTLTPRVGGPPLPIDRLGSAYEITPSDGQAVKVATVYRCVAILVDQISLLPFEAYRDNVKLDPQPSITKRPDPFLRRSATMSQIIVSLAMRGNAYIRVINRDGDGNATAISILDPDEVSVTWNRTRTRAVYEWRRMSMSVPDQLVHVSLFQTPGTVTGVSPITAGTPVIQGWRQQTEFSRRLFSDSATPSGVVESDNTVDPGDAANLKTQWTDALNGTRAPAILGGGLKFKAISITPEQAQFIDTAYSSSSDIARAFGIPGAVIDIPPPAGSAVLYQNVVSVLDSLVRLALTPYMERIEEAWFDLTPSTWETRFNTDRLLRGDPSTRFKVYEVAIRNGILTPNEARLAEGLQPLDEPIAVAAPVAELELEPEVANAE